MTHQLDVAVGRDIVARWCALAERRLEYLTELFETGRWRRFHSEVAFLENIQEAKAAVETWRDLLIARGISRQRRHRHVLARSNRGGAAARRELARSGSSGPAEGRGEFGRTAAEISIVPKADPVGVEEAFSAQAMADNPTELTPDVAAIAERYPLLRNAL